MSTPAGKVKIKISTKVSPLLAALRPSASILLIPTSTAVFIIIGPVDEGKF
jgi:hypothetical protein